MPAVSAAGHAAGIAHGLALGSERERSERRRRLAGERKTRKSAVDHPALLDVGLRDRDLTADDVSTDDPAIIDGEPQAAQVEAVLDGPFPRQLAGAQVPAAHLRRATAGGGQVVSISGEGQLARLTRGRPAADDLMGLRI